MSLLDDCLAGVQTVALSGHVRPDGDCCGSCLGMYLFLREQYPDLEVSLYLDPVPEKFRFLKGTDRILNAAEADKQKTFDLFISLDCGDKRRLGDAMLFFETAKRTLNIDHHISNQGFGDHNYVFPGSSSASELVGELIGPERISKAIAECLYLGLVHDTGVFQYSCTSSKTMAMAGMLMDKGIDYPKIVDETFFVRTYAQNRILGLALERSVLCMDGKCIYSVITKEDMETCGASGSDLEGIVSTLRSTEGVEVSVFLYQNEEKHFKISMRSASYVDVAAIAATYGGGGHVRAAGAAAYGAPDKILAGLLPKIEAQI